MTTTPSSLYTVDTMDMLPLAPNWPVVDEVTNDDNSIIALHPDTMDMLQLFRGDLVQLKGCAGYSILESSRLETS